MDKFEGIVEYFCHVPKRTVSIELFRNELGESCDCLDECNFCYQPLPVVAYLEKSRIRAGG